MLNFDPLKNTTAYNNLRYQVLVNVEENGNPKETPYFDSKWNPTIGIGFNLRESSVRKEVLEKLGFDMRQNPAPAEQRYRNEIEAKINANYSNHPSRAAAARALQTDLDQIMGRRYNDINIPAANRTHATFKFANSGEIQIVFDKLIKQYETKVDDWLPGIPDSKERAVLVSLAYENTTLLGDDLKQAIQKGNRADAYYEICYRSNKDSLSVAPPAGAAGVAKGRYYQSGVFSLYETGNSAADKDEAISVYQMFTRNRDHILKYEAAYGNVNGHAGTKGDQIAAANHEYHLDGTNNAIRSLANVLSSAADILTREYGHGRTFNPLNIQVASDAKYNLTGESTNARTGSNDDLLIGHATKGSRLDGGAGDDVLIGGSGNDVLIGGPGNNIMAGGGGHDTIIDEGRNTVNQRTKTNQNKTVGGALPPGGGKTGLLEHVRQVGRSGNLPLIVATEKAMVEGDLARYANNQPMANSLKTALNEIAAVERHIGTVDDKANSQGIDRGHGLSKQRKVPYDEARKALLSHYTRLNNMDKSRLSDDEKKVIDARKSAIFNADKLYADRLAKTLALDLGQSQRRGISA